MKKNIFQSNHFYLKCFVSNCFQKIDPDLANQDELLKKVKKKFDQSWHRLSYCSFFSFMWSCSLGSSSFCLLSQRSFRNWEGQTGWLTMTWRHDRSEYFCINTIQQSSSPGKDSICQKVKVQVELSILSETNNVFMLAGAG